MTKTIEASNELELGRVFFQHTQSLQFFVDHRFHLRWNDQILQICSEPQRWLPEGKYLQSCAKLVIHRLFVVLLQAQFLLDHSQLLHEHELAVLLVHFLLHFLANLLLQSTHLQFFLQQIEREHQPIGNL